MVKEYILSAVDTIKSRAKGFEINEKLDEIKEILADRGLYPKQEEPEVKKVNPVVVTLAIIGAVVAVAAIAYGVYYYFFAPEDSEYFEDFDEDEDEFEDSDLEDD